MKLSNEVLKKLNQASEWWATSVCINREAENKTIELVYVLLKEIGKVEFDEFHQKIKYPYCDSTGDWKIGCIKELYIDEDDAVGAVLVDGTKTCLENFDCLATSVIWDGILDSLDLSED